MKNVTDVLTFCEEFTFYDENNNERVMEINHVQDRIIRRLSKCDYISGDILIRLAGVKDAISLMVIDGKVENLVDEIDNFSVWFRITISRKCILR